MSRYSRSDVPVPRGVRRTAPHRPHLMGDRVPAFVFWGGHVFYQDALFDADAAHG